MVNSYVISVFNYASHHEMKVQLHTFSSWALSSCDLLASYPGHFTTGKYLALPPPHCLEVAGEEKKSLYQPGYAFLFSIPQPSHYTNSATSAWYKVVRV